MKLVLVAYPHVSVDDRRWIEDVREARDPQSALIAAHFTLVFPTDIRLNELAEHATSVVRSLPAIPFVIRSARAVPNVAGQGAHVFLVPDRGATEITELHDMLYRGVLAAHLRADIPFIPHVTVAAHHSLAECQRLALELNEQGREIIGEIRDLDVVAGEGEARSMAHIGFRP